MSRGSPSFSPRGAETAEGRPRGSRGGLQRRLATSPMGITRDLALGLPLQEGERRAAIELLRILRERAFEAHRPLDLAERSTRTARGRWAADEREPTLRRERSEVFAMGVRGRHGTARFCFRVVSRCSNRCSRPCQIGFIRSGGWLAQHGREGETAGRAKCFRLSFGHRRAVGRRVGNWRTRARLRETRPASGLLALLRLLLPRCAWRGRGCAGAACLAAPPDRSPRRAPRGARRRVRGSRGARRRWGRAPSKARARVGRTRFVKLVCVPRGRY